MSIRIKLLFIFLLVTAPALFAGNYFVFQEAQRGLLGTLAEKLEAVTSLQEIRTRTEIKNYLKETTLLISSERFKEALGAYNDEPSLDVIETISRIIQNERDSDALIETISIFDQHGVAVSSTKEAPVASLGNEEQNRGMQSAYIAGFSKNASNQLIISVIAPIFLQERVIGFARVEYDAANIIAITEDYTGLGETGEFLLAQATPQGDALFLTPLRFDSGASLARAIPRDRTELPIIPAVNGIETFLDDEHVVDYRGAPVIAYTRFIEGVDWGVVTKIDRVEALAPITRMKNIFISVVLLFYFVVIFIWVFVGERVFVRPLKKLTRFATNIQAGDFSHRVNLHTKDEIGKLSQAFNTMTDAVQEARDSLEAQVRIRTRELENTKSQLEERIRQSIVELKDKGFVRSILDNTPSVIYAKDLEGKYLAVNKKYETLFKVTSHDIIGKTDTDMFSSDIAQAFQANDHTVIEAKEMVTLEEQVPHDDGIHTYISVKFPLYDERNALIGVGGISTDITDRKKYEHDLKEKVDELEKVNKLLIGRELKMRELKNTIKELKDNQCP